jgi:hypothetical protein
MIVGFEPTIVGRVRQCPRCELRFGDEWELEDHLSADHGVDWVTHIPLAHFEHPAAH